RLFAEWHRVLRPGGRLLYTDPVVVTGLVSNEELATRSSTGYFEFCPPGVNEGLIRQAGFELVRVEDVTENEVQVSRHWHAARQQRAAELIRLEGEETFAGLQRFLAIVHRLTNERRLSRFAYLGRQPGEGQPRAERKRGHSSSGFARGSRCTAEPGVAADSGPSPALQVRLPLFPKCLLMSPPVFPCVAQPPRRQSGQ